jgi:hypothetical protein
MPFTKSQKTKLITYFILAFLLAGTSLRIYRHEVLIYDIHDAFMEDTGARIFPMENQAMKKIALRQNLPDVKLDDHLNQNALVQQWAFEYLYPLRINSNSNFIFTGQSKLYKSKCKFIDKENDIELYEC